MRVNPAGTSFGQMFWMFSLLMTVSLKVWAGPPIASSCDPVRATVEEAMRLARESIGHCRQQYPEMAIWLDEWDRNFSTALFSCADHIDFGAPASASLGVVEIRNDLLYRVRESSGVMRELPLFVHEYFHLGNAGNLRPIAHGRREKVTPQNACDSEDRSTDRISVLTALCTNSRLVMDRLSVVDRMIQKARDCGVGPSCVELFSQDHMPVRRAVNLSRAQAESLCSRILRQPAIRSCVITEKQTQLDASRERWSAEVRTALSRMEGRWEAQEVLASFSSDHRVAVLARDFLRVLAGGDAARLVPMLHMERDWISKLRGEGIARTIGLDAQVMTTWLGELARLDGLLANEMALHHVCDSREESRRAPASKSNSNNSAKKKAD